MKTQSVIVNAKATITEGKLKGQTGLVVGYVSNIDEVWLSLDSHTTALVKSAMIEQKVIQDSETTLQQTDNKNKTEDVYVYTASGECCESTFGTYEEALEELTKYEAWGVILKHLPFGFVDIRPEEKVVYEHLPHLKR